MYGEWFRSMAEDEDMCSAVEKARIKSFIDGEQVLPKLLGNAHPASPQNATKPRAPLEPLRIHGS